MVAGLSGEDNSYVITHYIWIKWEQIILRFQSSEANTNDQGICHIRIQVVSCWCEDPGKEFTVQHYRW